MCYRTEKQAGVNFINIFCTAFTPVVPQSVRTQSSRQYLFTLLGPTSVKAVRRTLMKLSPDVQTVPLRQVSGQRDGPEVDSLQRRKENPI